VRIDILAVGSNGDVRPTVALGLGLQQAGHRVRIVALDGFEELVRRNGLDYLSIGGSPSEIADTTAGQHWIRRRDSTVGFLRGFVGVADALIASGIARYWQDCKDTDAMIVTALGLLVGAHVAEKLRVPMIRVAFAPTRHDWEGRGDWPTALRGKLALLAWAAFRLGLWSRLRRVTNEAREKILDLPPLPWSEPSNAMDRKGVPVFDAYSPVVVPAPSEYQWIHVTGYWFLDEAVGFTPSRELSDFLAAGPPPLFVGFGSTPFPSPGAATDLVVGALARARQRAVVVSGGSGLETGRLNDQVLSVDSVPHGWLFPQVSAVVHHGGAGVTGAALRAGRPAVVVPVFADQPFWGKRVFDLGVGARPIPAKRLSVEALASAIRCVTGDQEMRRRAAEVGTQIRAEDGVARAVEVFHKYVGA
jgi:UDP:flavonoid glycosyltransferase YjiC (YdhE family)